MTDEGVDGSAPDVDMVRTRMRPRLVLSSLFVASLLVVSACSSSRKEPGTAPVYVEAGASSRPSPASDPPVDAAIERAIRTASASVAPGMTADGQIGRATLGEGEHFAMLLTLHPSRCYTFVGFAPPDSTSRFEMKLFAVFGAATNVQRTAGTEVAMPIGTSGPLGSAPPGISVIGKTTDAICPSTPATTPYKLDVVATKGSVQVGVMVFSREK